MKHLLSGCMYLGAGFAFHALFVGTVIDWSSAWSLGWLFGWPVMIWVACWGVFLSLLIIAGVVAAVIFTTLWIRDKQREKKWRAEKLARSNRSFR